MLWGFLGFIITIGLLVTIHEWGHFAMARFFGVKILRFSLGFGKPIFTYIGKKEGTKYTLAPIPLGGFVQMYGETEGEEIPVANKESTFSGKPAWQRFLIAFAGPAVNLIFAIFAFSLLFVFGVKGVLPATVHVAPDSIAAHAGIEKGDVFYRINGKRVKLASDAHVALSSANHEKIAVIYLRDGIERQTMFDLSSLQAGDEMQIGRATGLYLADEWWPAIVGEVLEPSSSKNYQMGDDFRLAAKEIGLKAGDQILAINGQLLNANDAVFVISEKVSAMPDAEIRFSVRRGEKIIELNGQLGHRSIREKKYGFLGVVWQRMPDKHFFAKYEVVERYNVFSAVRKGIEKTGYYVKLTFNMFARIIKREVSIDNVGGPLTIGDAAGKTLRIGWNVFLNFLGVVSLSLAAINLLPIPMLDGGHMLFCVVETIRGKPLSDRAMTWCFRVGTFLLLSFMGFVLINDFWRYFIR